MSQKLVSKQNRKSPDGWKIVKISDVIQDQLSGFACAIDKLVEKDGYVHLRPFNLGGDWKLDLSTLYQVPIDLVDDTRYYLKKGDVLFNNTNSTELVGKSVLVDKDLNFAFSNHINRIRVNANVVLPEYFYYYLRHMFFNGHFSRNCKKWIGQSGYTLTKLKEQMIIISPLSEQQKIVDRLDRQMTQIEMMNKETERQLESSETLFQSFLKRIYDKISIRKPLIQLCNKTQTRNPKKEPDKYFTYIDISGVYNKRKKIVSTKKILGKNAPSRARKVVLENDVIVSTTRPNLNAVAMISPSLNNQIASTGFCILRPTNDLDPKYLFYYTQSAGFIQNLSDLVKGAVYPAVTDKQVFAQEIPYVEVEKQKALVKAIEKRFILLQLLVKQANVKVCAIHLLPSSILNEVFGQYEIPKEV